MLVVCQVEVGLAAASLWCCYRSVTRRVRRLARCLCVTTVATIAAGSMGWVLEGLLQAGFWRVLGVAVGIPLVWIAARWSAERQRRATLVDVVLKAPEGTVLVQQKGLGGPALLMIVGSGDRHDSRGRV